jgi:hypothetical protein
MTTQADRLKPRTTIKFDNKADAEAYVRDKQKADASAGFDVVESHGSPYVFVTRSYSHKCEPPSAKYVDCQCGHPDHDKRVPDTSILEWAMAQKGEA